MIASNDGASGLGEIPVSIAWQAEQCFWANASPCRWTANSVRLLSFAGLACPVAIAPLTTTTAIRIFKSIASSSSGCHGRISEEHTSELQSLLRISYAVLCFKKKNIFTPVCHNINQNTYKTS